MTLRSSKSLALAGTCSALALAAFASPAMAQDDAAPQEAEEQSGVSTIIVTAQRREESVQDVPIAISAFNQETLEQRGIGTALEVAQFVPNLVGLNNTGLGTANAYYLRGIGNTESIATFDPPIGTYVDDIYLSRQNANNLSFFDVERVEVLRGPQGTLFGRNTTGGAVNVFLAEPGDEVAGYAEIGYGSYDRKLARASIDIPLAETFAIKLSGYWQNDDGWAKNVITGERTNENDGWGVRLGLRGELSDTARWTGSYIHTYADSANLLNFDCDPLAAQELNIPDDCDGRFVATGMTENGNFTNAFLGDLLTGRKNDFGLGNQTRMNFVSSNFEFELSPEWSVNIISGFVDIGQKFALDFADGRGLPSTSNPIPPVIGFTYGGFTIANDGEHTQYTQEIKLNGSLGDGLIDLVGGVYYFKEENRTDFGDIFSLPIVFPLPDGYPLLLADRVINNEAEAWAGYVQADVNVTDQLTLTAGIRYTDEEKTFDIRDNRNRLGGNLCIGPGQFGPSTCIDTANLSVNVTPRDAAGNPTGPAAPVAIPSKQSVGVWTPRFAINYDVSDDVLLFASATRGFKSGGWNARGTAPAELLPFAPEKAWSYEAGFKSTLFDRLLQLNVTAFWLDVGGLQTPSAFTRADGSLAFITRNFADYRNKGIEVELTAAPADGFNLFAAIGYQDDKYRLDSDAAPFDEYGIKSVGRQLSDCRAQLALGLIPNTSGADNAPDCGVGIVSPLGELAEPVRTPDWTVALGGSYDVEFGDFTFTPAMNASWRSKSEVGTSEVTLYDGDVLGPNSGNTYPANTIGLGDFIDPLSGSFSDDRWIVNASVTLSNVAGWSLVAECKNCFDEEAIESALANYGYLNSPRTWTLRAKFDF
ncbi:TonB-dependent receptor [Altererythrobacter sp. GH1-8]|uniref:TonB-dependent receptor n=1 Tax=Altererythrobacter sp. GH1-8 TaxID=3349333 RepID=UPI00374D9170